MLTYITIGISASGKSTWASSFAPTINATIINRDDIRKQLCVDKGLISDPSKFTWPIWKFKWEPEVTKIQYSFLTTRNSNIIISDTNLNYDRLSNLVATLTAANYKVVLQLFPISYDVAVTRDNIRCNGVGASVIRKQYYQFNQLISKLNADSYLSKLVANPLPNSLQHTKSSTKQDIILFDIDGTVAHSTGRSPFDWDQVHTDSPDNLLCELIGMYLSVNSHKVVFLSGRDSVCYDSTLTWIKQHIPNVRFTPSGNAQLFMRACNDMRKDYIVKQELFLNHIEPYYNVLAVFDDRPQVVRTWYDLGLKVWACNDQLIEF